MGDTDLTTEGGDIGDMESFANDYDSYDDADEGLINDLEDLEINDLNSKFFKGLDGVKFDDEDDNDYDDDDQELQDLCQPSDETSSQALVTQESGKEEDGAEIGSDEERDILQGIREDIELKVREEMEEELQTFQERMKAIQEGRLPGRTDDEKNNYATVEENEEMNPQLREAIIKMNKLDKILRKKVKREKEVKKERILLERRMRQEISEMEQGASNYKEIKMNTEKFLALAPPPSHNEGVSLESEDEEEMPPLFQTQFDESELDRRKKGKANFDDGNTPGNGQTRSESSISSQGNRSRASKSGVGVGAQSRKKAKKKDFIKRNKELAGEADQPVAMTDDEKRRLQSLLEGVDELPELEEGEDISSLMEVNPFQLTVQPGEGFCPDTSESRTLSSIDQRLKGLMPEEDFKSIFNGESGFARGRDSIQATPSQQQLLFTRVGLHSTGNDAAALDRFGERVLYETKEERELKARLLAIESQLEQFKTPMEDEAAEDCHLTDQMLDQLLDQCARNMAHTLESDTPESTPRSQLSSRQSLLANPPRLTDEQLQQLLSDAQFPLSSRLLALRDDDQKLEEEDGSTEMIRAETWIAIRDAKLDENFEEIDGAQALQAGGLTDTDKNSSLEAKSSSKVNSLNISEAKAVRGGGHRNVNVQQNRNMSTNNTYCNEMAGASTKANFPERREIDHLAFTPDITNPAYANDSEEHFTSGHSAEPVHPRESTLGRDMELRRESGGARSKLGGSVELPKLQSSSFIRGSVESEGTSRLDSPSLASSSRDSFDSFIPSNNNNNGSQDGIQHQVRLPEIPTGSFLIHTPQGMNNDERTQPRNTLPSRPPLHMVRNNLSDMSVTSMSTSDREEDTTPTIQASRVSSAGKNNTSSPAGRRVPQHSQMMQPTPPSTKKQT
ncbi:fibrous sheath-interacting protein 1-like [Elysia marginata]|uniref:Fibrous sheath-interacting protein 1 n=1 Tax=Elysia marginata TaxID=1093978 RepID=A0AAV4EHT1_9GAST|nr:fibrous sheath-interacting protein 1-like [Elysia marginata]